MRIFTASVTDFVDYSPSTFTFGVYSSCYNAFMALTQMIQSYDPTECIGNIAVGEIDGEKAIINLVYYPRQNKWHVSSAPTGHDRAPTPKDMLNEWLHDDTNIIKQAKEYLSTHSKPL
jgi:hypothetical protein